MIAASVLEYTFITVTCCGEITEKLYVAVSTKDVAIAILTAGKHAHTHTDPTEYTTRTTNAIGNESHDWKAAIRATSDSAHERT